MQVCFKLPKLSNFFFTGCQDSGHPYQDAPASIVARFFCVWTGRIGNIAF
jgi:hypothetical protein